jgi:hypothetical protein
MKMKVSFTGLLVVAGLGMNAQILGNANFEHWAPGSRILYGFDARELVELQL